GFYAIIVAATVIGTGMSMLEVDPMDALVWSAVINGVISVPIMIAMLWIGQSPHIVGRYTMTLRHRFFGWSAAAVMAIAVVFMCVTAFLK
ncbi:MAG TPA: hypothetical protein VFS24_01075, partial [Steroidobacteraceae bacterium]|nr:hypothetical protein [Steroidobacteraceae bacterium]